MEQLQPNPEFMSVKQLAQRYPFKTVAGWRWTMFNADQNGFQKAIRKVGGRVVLLDSEVTSWIREQI